MAKRQPKIADLEGEGTLYVQLLRANGLPAADDNGLSDPYAKLSLGEHKQRSRKMRRTLNPVWHDEVFAYTGVLGQIISEPLKLTMWDFDLTSSDDLLGHVDIELADHTYCNHLRRDLTAELDTSGEVVIQVWWEPEEDGDDGDDDQKRRGRGRGRSATTEKFSYYGYVKGWVLYLVPERYQSFKGCCASCCIKVMHPDSKFRSGWNVCLAFFILYCGIAVPLEIAFETDMVQAMCTDPKDPFGPQIFRSMCTDYLLWFWLNFLVDMWFICDIVLNFRTGFMHEGHFVSDDWEVAKTYLKGSFMMDVAGTFPINIVTMVLNPDNPYGDPQVTALQAEAAGGGGMDAGRANRMLRLMRMAKLTKLARMRKLAKTLEAFEEYLNPGVLAVFKLVFIALFCCHLFGCLWWMISDLELVEEESGASPDSWFVSPWYAGENKWHPPHWLKHEASMTMKYMHAFFWGAGMVTSLVPRDIEPLTVMESIITNSTMFFGLLLNAFVISSLNQALASMNSKKEFTGKQLESIKSYLVIKAVPPALRGRIMEYYEYLLSSSAALEDMHMFDNLPPNLTAQLNISTNRRLATRCAFFHSVGNSSLVTLIGEMHALVMIPGQMVARQGMPLAAAYFINRGIVQISTHDAVHGTLTNTENFGLEDFWASCIAHIGKFWESEPKVSQSAQAVTYCDLMSLEVDSMKHVLQTDATFKTALEEARRVARAAAEASKAAKGRGLRRQSTTSRQSTFGRGFSPPSRLQSALKKWPGIGELRRLNSSQSSELGTVVESDGPAFPATVERERDVNACIRLARSLRFQDDSELMEAIEQPTKGNSPSSQGNSPTNSTSSTASGMTTRRTPLLRSALLRAAARLDPRLLAQAEAAALNKKLLHEASKRATAAEEAVAVANARADSAAERATSLADGLAELKARLQRFETVADAASASGSARRPPPLAIAPATSSSASTTLRLRDEDYAQDVASSARAAISPHADPQDPTSARSRPGKLSARSTPRSAAALSALGSATPAESRAPTAFIRSSTSSQAPPIQGAPAAAERIDLELLAQPQSAVKVMPRSVDFKVVEDAAPPSHTSPAPPMVKATPVKANAQRAPMATRTPGDIARAAELFQKVLGTDRAGSSSNSVSC